MLVPQLSKLLNGLIPVTIAEHSPESLTADRLAGQLITGGSVSLTMTLKLQVLILEAASRAMKLMLVVPTGKKLPLGKPLV